MCTIASEIVTNREEEGEPRMGSQQTSLDDRRILLVDDDDRIINFMQRGLEAEGLQVDVASANDQALHLTESHRYDAVILDIFLGNDDGLELCRILRERSIDTPVLVMTAKDCPELREAGRQAGASAYLPKPFSFEDLLGTLKSFQPASECEAPHGTTPPGTLS